MNTAICIGVLVIFGLLACKLLLPLFYNLFADVINMIIFILNGIVFDRIDKSIPKLPKMTKASRK